MAFQSSLKINEVINNDKLCQIFLCAPQGGMRRSIRTNTLTLISDKTKLYDDRIVGDIYHYTGMGQSGNQKLSGQNLTLAESNFNGVEIHFFEVMKPREYTYRGLVELADKPYQDKQYDRNGAERLVWIFPLRLKNKNAKFSEAPLLTNNKNELKKEFLELEKIEQLPLTETEKEIFVKARIGQGKFKKLLLERETKCTLCGVSDKRMLIASHIIPWSISNNEERLDVNNGLLLCPSHDALFDKNLISFNDNGEIVISDTLNEVDRIFLNVNKKMGIKLNEKQAYYMKSHLEKLK